MDMRRLTTALLVSALALLGAEAQEPLAQYRCLYTYEYKAPQDTIASDQTTETPKKRKIKVQEGDQFYEIFVDGVKQENKVGRSDVPYRTHLLLQIGDTRSYCRDYTAYRIDSLLSAPDHTDADLKKLQSEMDSNPYLFDPAITMDMEKGEMKVLASIPISFYRYTEPLEPIDWQLSDETKEVCGYDCKTARGTYGGRTWVVRYAPEIPSSWGPWKLWGLPGLVLEAEDEEGIHHFSATQFLKAEEPMLRPDDSMAIPISRKDFIRKDLETGSPLSSINVEQISEMTVSMESGGQKIVSINDFVAHPEAWQAYPLEIE